MNLLQPDQQRLSISWAHAWMVLYGVGWSVTFDLGVRVYAAELVTLVGLLFLRWRAVFQYYPALRKVLTAYALWATAIILSDLVNGTALIDIFRNLGTPILGALSLVFVATVFSRNMSALLAYLAASAGANIFLGSGSYGSMFEGYEVSIDSIRDNTNLFKVLVEPHLTPVILLLAYMSAKKNIKIASMVFAIGALAYFIVDSRSSALILLISALMLSVIDNQSKMTKGKLFLSIVLVVIVGYIAYLGYVYYTIELNPDGHNGKQLRQITNYYNPFNLLLQGRSEWTVIPAAISERPFFGWGSWAQDHDLRFTIMRAEISSGSALNQLLFTDPKYYIPVHSLIGAAWVWSGLLGLIAMMWLLRIVWALVRVVVSLDTPYLPIVLFLSIGFAWAYFFSPPMVVRLGYPVTLAALIVLANNFFESNKASALT